MPTDGCTQPARGRKVTPKGARNKPVNSGRYSRYALSLLPCPRPIVFLSMLNEKNGDGALIAESTRMSGCAGSTGAAAMPLPARLLCRGCRCTAEPRAALLRLRRIARAFYKLTYGICRINQAFPDLARGTSLPHIAAHRVQRDMQPFGCSSCVSILSSLSWTNYIGSNHLALTMSRRSQHFDVTIHSQCIHCLILANTYFHLILDDTTAILPEKVLGSLSVTNLKG